MTRKVFFTFAFIAFAIRLLIAQPLTNLSTRLENGVGTNGINASTNTPALGMTPQEVADAVAAYTTAHTSQEQQSAPQNQNVWTPAEQAELRARGLDPQYCTPIPAISNKSTPQQQTTLSPTPDDLKNAAVCMDSFLGMTNAILQADVISMKPESLKFRINGQDYSYSGHYAVTLNTPRQHKKSYLGLGTTETAKVLILENWAGNMVPLQNATIWEKSSGFIDAVALDKEWIYSGTYTIQN